MAREIAKVEVADSIKEFDQFLVSLSNSLSKFGAVDVEVVKEALETALGCCTDGRSFDVLEDALQRLVEVR